MTRFPPAFYRTAAIASGLSAATTLMLIYLPDLYAPGEGFEARMQRVNDPAYRLRAWVYLIHPILVFTAALAIAVRLRREAPALMLAGAISFGLWAATEAGQQTLTLFMFDPWRLAWLAGDPAVRATMAVRTALYDGLWDAAYTLLLIGFFIGCVAYGAVFVRRHGLERVIGILYILAALLTARYFAGMLGAPGLPPMLEQWFYPSVQPLARLLIGIWLWKNAMEVTSVASTPIERD